MNIRLIKAAASVVEILCLLAVSLLLSGCGGTPRPSTEQTARRDISAKLRSGMSKSEVDAALGTPSDFRPASGDKADVGVYLVQGQRITVYFYRGNLTRFVSSRQPVNR